MYEVERKKDANRKWWYLAINSVNLPVLILQFAAHIDSHVPEIANHGVDLSHVILHLALSSVAGNSGDVSALWPDTVTVIHHSLGLIIHDLAVVVTFPRSFIFLKTRTPAMSSYHINFVIITHPICTPVLFYPEINFNSSLFSKTFFSQFSRQSYKMNQLLQ